MKFIELHPIFHSEYYKGESIKLIISTPFGLSFSMKPFETQDTVLNVYPLTRCCGVEPNRRIPKQGLYTEAIKPAPTCSKCKSPTSLGIEFIEFHRLQYDLQSWDLDKTQFDQLEQLAYLWAGPLESTLVASHIEAAVIDVMNSVEYSCRKLLKDTRASLDNRRLYEFLLEACADSEGEINAKP